MRAHPSARWRAQQHGAMRNVFWFLGLAALAVALALLVGRNVATFTLFWPPYRYDISFIFLVFALIVAFVLLHAALRAIATLRELPAQAQRWRSQQIERSVVGSVIDALSHQLAGRFVRSQAAAHQALTQLKAGSHHTWPRRHQFELLAHLLLAESAQALQNRERRDEHLQAALQPELAVHSPESFEGALLRSVRWAIEDRDPVAARSRLAELPQGASRRIQALRLKLQIARLGGATAEALETARLLSKHHAFSPAASRSIVRGLALDALAEAHDLSQLQAVWNRLEASERQMPELVLAAAQRANQLVLEADHVSETDRDAATQMVRSWLLPLWSVVGTLDGQHQRELVLALEPGLSRLDSDWLGRLEQAQRQWPSNPYLQYLSGQAFVQRQLWGKAAQLLAQASHTLQDPRMLRRTWVALARLAEERDDHGGAQLAWKKAALID
jgi:HemY protein